MSMNDYIKFMTQQFVSYMDSPKEERKEKRQQKKTQKEPFLNRWFGVLPLGVTLLYRKASDKQPKKQA
ncbi:YqzE family protein [Ectobacillus sp. JY-23]|uniref:YqzE family protein n=1 Tax=Ectobacillus sp. JY-23 TaxID=2933872 RepID=UPI001FF2D9B6|nr:YqzE family protein [Ectobacillus sp. JY-23]UOY93988.1 YqzE family protein [Ectobacillus sp. JY-23]